MATSIPPRQPRRHDSLTLSLTGYDPSCDSATNRTSRSRLLEPLQKVLGYPPLLLMALTIIALLLAMGTAARADELVPAAAEHDAAPASADPIERAAADLADATWDEFTAYVPERRHIVLTERFGDGDGELDTDIWRQTYDQTLDQATWAIEIEPVLSLLRATKAPALGGFVCEGGGVCVQAGDGYRVRLELGREGSAVKLLAIEIVWDEIVGC